MNKKIMLCSVFFFLLSSLNAQTNIFPSTGSVGIGTLTPASKLEVNGDISANFVVLKTGGLVRYLPGNMYFDMPNSDNNTEGFIFNGASRTLAYLTSNGKLGLGYFNISRSPDYRLHVDGTIKTDSIIITKGAQNGYVLTSDAIGNAKWQPLSTGQTNYFTQIGNNITLVEPYDLKLNHNLFVTQNINWGNSILRTDQGGSIEMGGNNAIAGTGTPYIDFHFNGKTEDYNARIINSANGELKISAANGVIINGKGLLAKEICVKSDLTWCDYVFDKDYKLLSLYDLEKYIKKNKHLPEIPDSKTVEENGISLSEMVTLQMKKIEELSLYTIELQKQLDEVKKEIIKYKSVK